jgi:tetratricopeptide (TPR) repeat protein
MDDRTFFSENIVAWLEGELDAIAAKRMQRCVESDSHLRNEYESFKELFGALDTAGDRHRQTDFAQDLNLLPAVLREVAVIDRTAQREQFRTIHAIPAKSRLRPVMAYAIAAMLLLTVGLSWWAYQNSSERPNDNTQMAGSQDTAVDTSTTTDPSKLPTPVISHLQQRLMDLKNQSPIAVPAIDFAKTESPDLETLTSSDIVKMRRDASVSMESRATLASLATLPEDKARAIATSETASAEVVAGAIDSLPDDEAAALLMTAMGRYEGTAPEKRAALQFALASKTGEWSGFPPENALPFYFEAGRLLGAGQLEEALAMLDAAAELPEASAYSIEAANNGAAALVAAGVDPAAARLLQSLTAGTEEYQTLMELGNRLIEAASLYSQQGDTETARRIYEAALRLGDQLDSSSVARERLAGLDIQREAISNLEPTYTATGDTAALEQLTVEADSLTVSVTEMAQFFEALDELFASDLGAGFLSQIADVILNYGDVHLFEFLR